MRRTAGMASKIILACVAVALAAGCGGSDDDVTTSSSPEPASTTSVSVSTTDVATTIGSGPGPGSGSDESTPTPAESAPVVAVDPAVFATPDYGYVWTSPTGNISCRIAEGEYTSGCMSGDAPVPDGAQADCATPSFTIDQLGKGFYLQSDKVIPTCFNQGIFSLESAPELEYGTSITVDGYTCMSRETGMSCTTSNGHGFELSNEVATSY